MAQARLIGAAGGKVAVLFGPERAGLENSDIAAAQTIISVDVNPAFPSLILAQCVLLCAYEWRRQADRAVVEADPIDLARREEIAHLGAHYEAQLEEAGFFWPPEKAASMKLPLRNLWGRWLLSSADVQTLLVVMRQMVRWADRRRDKNGRTSAPRGLRRTPCVAGGKFFPEKIWARAAGLGRWCRCRGCLKGRGRRDTCCAT